MATFCMGRDSPPHLSTARSQRLWGRPTEPVAKARVVSVSPGPGLQAASPCSPQHVAVARARHAGTTPGPRAKAAPSSPPPADLQRLGTARGAAADTHSHAHCPQPQTHTQSHALSTHALSTAADTRTVHSHRHTQSHALSTAADARAVTHRPAKADALRGSSPPGLGQSGSRPPFPSSLLAASVPSSQLAPRNRVPPTAPDLQERALCQFWGPAPELGVPAGWGLACRWRLSLCAHGGAGGGSAS